MDGQVRLVPKHSTAEAIVLLAVVGGEAKPEDAWLYSADCKVGMRRVRNWNSFPAPSARLATGESAGPTTLWWCHILIDQLESNRSYSFALMVNKTGKGAFTKSRTLPRKLDERGLTINLASCFDTGSDR